MTSGSVSSKKVSQAQFSANVASTLSNLKSQGYAQKTTPAKTSTVKTSSVSSPKNTTQIKTSVSGITGVINAANAIGIIGNANKAITTAKLSLGALAGSVILGGAVAGASATTAGIAEVSQSAAVPIAAAASTGVWTGLKYGAVGAAIGGIASLFLGGKTGAIKDSPITQSINPPITQNPQQEQPINVKIDAPYTNTQKTDNSIRNSPGARINSNPTQSPVQNISPDISPSQAQSLPLDFDASQGASQGTGGDTNWLMIAAIAAGVFLLKD